MEKLVEALVGRLFVPLEASGRHVHVTAQQAQTLFGHGLTPERPLSQPGCLLFSLPVGLKRSVRVWGASRPPPVAESREASEWQRSIKSRKSVSPKILSGTANGHRHQNTYPYLIQWYQQG